MPAISELNYGFDAAGIQQYVNDIKSEAIQQAEDAVRNISAIETCCNNEWEGRARDNFLANLRKDSEHVAEQFEALYEGLTNEINALASAMAQKDHTLIAIDD